MRHRALAYNGISVKMLVDKVLGADHLTMFTVDYELGGAAQAHDHPFEETYFFLAGEVEAELDGIAVHLVAGRRRLRRRRQRARLLERGHRTGALDRDTGAPAAGADSYRWQPTGNGGAPRGSSRWPEAPERGSNRAFGP